MLIGCLIVDDEPPARAELACIVGDIKDAVIVATAGNAEEALRAIAVYKPDLVFLDIQMPQMNGFELVREVGRLGQHQPLFIFVTAYDQYAVKAFEVEAVDYILKPFSEERVLKSFERARQMLAGSKQAFLSNRMEELISRMEQSPDVVKLSVDSKGRIRVLDAQEIVFCKAENKGVTVYTQNEAYALYSQLTMDDLEKKLVPKAFFRVHRSYLINLAFIKEVVPWFGGRYVVIVSNTEQTEIPVSRQRVKELKTALGI